MATFISSLILYGFLATIVGFVGKLIYDTQQSKKKEKEADYKQQFQKLAGIGLPKNETDPELLRELADKWSKDGFPESDQSIPVGATKITTIDTNFGSDNDPLASVPMSRVSKEAKQKMAQIAKEDIKVTTEAKANELISKGLVTIPAETKPKRKYKKKATK